jgi:hypothetical protein
MTLQLHDEGLSGFNFRRFGRKALTTYNPYYRAAKLAIDNRKKIANFGKEAVTTYNPYYQAAKFAWRRRPRFLRDEYTLSDNSGAYQEILQNIQGTPTYTQFLRETGMSGLEESGELAGRFGTWIKTKAVPGLKKLQTNLAPVIGLLPGGGVVNAAFDIINRPKGAAGIAPEPQPVISPIMPAPMPEPMAPSYAMAPPPTFFPQMAPQTGGINLPFGLDLKSLALIGVTGILAYKLLKS